MLVLRSQIKEALERLSTFSHIALDTETTGLRPWQMHRPFSCVMAGSDRPEDTFYFNFQYYPMANAGESREAMLGDDERALLRKFLASDPARVWYMHNAKFDMAMLYQVGLPVIGDIRCSWALGRVLRGDLMSYSLDALSKRWLGAEKSDAVKRYCLENKLYVMVDDPKKPGKKKKDLCYHLVPLDVIVPYAELDAVLTWRLGEFLRDAFAKIDASGSDPARSVTMPPVSGVVNNEISLTRRLFDMERRGVRLDSRYTAAALLDANEQAAKCSDDFKALCGFPMNDLDGTLANAFAACGLSRPAGAVGWDKSVLKAVDHPLTKAALGWRSATKKASTFYANFLFYADENSVIHTNYHQAGAKTGRMSSSDPNMQNLCKDELAEEEGEEKFFVRRCFVPATPEHAFFAPDYDQMEYRLMLEYAREMSVIEQVLAGIDVHQATATFLGITRKEAKTINFMLLYGGGVAKLAKALGCSESEARSKREFYFARLPGIQRFIHRVKDVARTRGYIVNWAGRRYQLTDPAYDYVMPNYLIQGGCSEIAKRAQVACAEFLEANTTKSWLTLQIHDELVLDLHRDDFHLAPAINDIIGKVYPSKLLPITASPKFSHRSLHDMVDGFPS